MQLRMWMLDVAREQAFTLDQLRKICQRTQDAGFNALGLYLEHRFAYPSMPWARGKECITPEMVTALEGEFPELQLIPFLNLLGHFEGMLYTEEGRLFAEQKFDGMQACPSNPGFVMLAKQIIDDTVAAFKSDLIHIGGDETWQLGKCERCTARANTAVEAGASDGKAALYASHFGPLAEYVTSLGRRPAVWGDMFFDHPTALAAIPKNTLIFDWEYFCGPWETSEVFRDAGYEVVFSPTLHTYSATWFHLAQAERNVREHIQAARDLDAYGVCVTTWEAGLFGNYETLLPAIEACGELLNSTETLATRPEDSGDLPKLRWSRENYLEDRAGEHFLRGYLRISERHEEWARLMGIELQSAGAMFDYTGHRSVLRTRSLLWANPFLAWRHHGEELSGPAGDKALEILERATAVSPDSATRGVSDMAKTLVRFVRQAELAHQAYARGAVGDAVSALAPTRISFEDLEKIAIGNNLRFGGSLADIERCRVAKTHIETVIRRIQQYGDRSLGYLPSFETITHPKFVPHDQACWWLINSWGNE